MKKKIPKAVHGIAYQEESNVSVELEVVADIPKSGRRAVSFQPINLPQRKIVPHKNSVPFGDISEDQQNEDQSPAKTLFLPWRLMRKVSSMPIQTVSRFVGWVIETRHTKLQVHKNNFPATN